MSRLGRSVAAREDDEQVPHVAWQRVPEGEDHPDLAVERDRR